MNGCLVAYELYLSVAVSLREHQYSPEVKIQAP